MQIRQIRGGKSFVRTYTSLIYRPIKSRVELIKQRASFCYRMTRARILRSFFPVREKRGFSKCLIATRTNCGPYWEGGEGEGGVALACLERRATFAASKLECNQARKLARNFIGSNRVALTTARAIQFQIRARLCRLHSNELVRGDVWSGM